MTNLNRSISFKKNPLYAFLFQAAPIVMLICMCVCLSCTYIPEAAPSSSVLIANPSPTPTGTPIGTPPPISIKDDLLFIHHSVGSNWLNSALSDALLTKSYIDEVNEITYGTDCTPSAGRPDSLADTPGDLTDMQHWIYWFNDYFDTILTIDCGNGINRIVMFKSCYPNSSVESAGIEPGNPFSAEQTIANYKAIYRHPSGTGNIYSDNNFTYYPLEAIFAAHPEILFIPVTAPPLNYGPSDATTDAEGHNARLFNNWLKNEWLMQYKTAHPGIDNVAIFDFFDFLAYTDNAAAHPNRLKQIYGGDSGDSHPNLTANTEAAAFFAGTNAFLDSAWNLFSQQ